MASINGYPKASANTITSFATFCDVSLNGNHVSPEGQCPTFSIPSENAFATDPLIEKQSSISSRASPKQAKITTTLRPVKWGITRWQSSSMFLTTIAGFILAILHHVYYTLLDNSIAGSPSRQQWSLNIGTAFAFGVVAVFKTAGGMAYDQYVWRTVKMKSISVAGLDNLFALTTNPFGFFDWELWNKATLPVLQALLCWCLTLGGLVPPGTLTVISNLTEITHMANVKTFNFNQSNSDYLANYMGQQSPLQKLATDMAAGLSPVMGSKPADNSSYNLHFFGPALRCNPPNETQREWFNYFSQTYLDETGAINLTQYNLGVVEGSATYLVYSAFSPQLWALEDSFTYPNDPAGGYNWNPDFPIDCTSIAMSNNSCFKYWFGGASSSSLQYWIYLADEYLICTSSNASFDISFEFINGQQNVIQTNVDVVSDWTTIYNTTKPGVWYLRAFQALGDLIYGNVSIELPGFGESGFAPPLYYSLTTDSQSPVLTTGLVGYDEFLHTPWFNISMTFNQHCGAFPNGTNAPTPCGTFTTRPSPYNFGGDSSMCRNKTIARAVEDLAANLTISMLSYPDVTVDINVPVTVFGTRNIYTYKASNLLLSYGLTAFFAVLAVVIGLDALHANGVQHSTSFSSILFTTRNPELDKIAAGQSLGTKPLPREIRDRKLMFGTIDGSGQKGTHRGIKHIAFGLDGAVGQLRKGGAYI